jgi:predicted methyltransferase
MSHSNFALALVPVLLLGCALVPPRDSSLENRVAEVTGVLERSPRTEADRAQDAQRQTARLIAFAGIPRGAAVVDVGALGGYFSEALAQWVGPRGRVIAQNPTIFARFDKGRPIRELTARVESGRISNITMLQAEFGELGVVDGPLDAATIMFVWHDAMTEDAGRRAALCRRVFEALKPGAPLLVADHQGTGTPEDPSLHRVARDTVVGEIETCGFRLEAELDALRNPADDLAQPIFNPEIRGRTDRFVLRFRRP